MPLKITVRQSSGVSIIDLEGRLVIGPDADALKQRLDELARQGSRHILVNLAKVTQLDSSGICSLLHGYTMMKQHGGSFKMLHRRDTRAKSSKSCASSKLFPPWMMKSRPSPASRALIPRNPELQNFFRNFS